MRVALIDLGRSCAILAMVVFHLTFDLEMFGFVSSGTIMSRPWMLFAQAIAGSFLMLSGMSLVLAGRHGVIAWRKYLWRLGQLGLAALAVTLVTRLAMGEAFVRFGILHCLFAASILGLLFLKVPYWITGMVGAGITAVPHVITWPMLVDPMWLWAGQIAPPAPFMVDYVPLVPWFGVFLLGMGLGQGIASHDGWDAIARIMSRDTRGARFLTWPGQHSLLIYLVHQPVLIALVYVANLLR